MKKIITLFSLLFCYSFSFSQSELDSIETVLKKSPEDTSKVIALNSLSRNYFNIPNYEKAILIGKQSLQLAEKINFKKGIAQASNNIGISYYGLEEYEKALDFHNKALAIRLELGNNKDIFASYSNIGNVYEGRTDYGLALDFKTKALKLSEKLGDKVLIAGSNNGLANIQLSLHNYDKALEYCFMAQRIFAELNDLPEITRTFLTAANIYKENKSYALSNTNAIKALLLADSLGDMDISWKAHGILYLNYSTLKDPAKALFHHEKYITLRDSIYSIERAKNLAEEESKMEFEKKEQQIKFEQEKKDVIATSESKRQKVIIWSVFVGLLLVIVFAGFIFRSWRVTRRQKQVIEKQKEIVDVRNIEIEEQKKLVEEKNKDITDSINYAQRIQHAMLPHRRDIWIAFPQSFVLFKPKDIVSGDFYFFHKKDQYSFIAAADCTGHGVPGAFMSMIGSDKLEDAVLQSMDTSEILSLLNKGVKTSLKQSEDDDSTRDGMDIALCSVDTENRIVKYAGANRPIWIIRKGQTEVEEIKATKKAIGGFTEDNQLFESHEIKLQKGDTFYLSTDGYADTFGKGGKKMMTKQFKEILLGIQHKTMKDQEKHLDEFVENWKSGVEQVDDILVIGIRV